MQHRILIARIPTSTAFNYFNMKRRKPQNPRKKLPELMALGVVLTQTLIRKIASKSFISFVAFAPDDVQDLLDIRYWILRIGSIVTSCVQFTNFRSLRWRCRWFHSHSQKWGGTHRRNYRFTHSLHLNSSALVNLKTLFTIEIIYSSISDGYSWTYNVYIVQHQNF